MKKIIFTEKAPAPIGPYNQAVLSGNTLYASGQIAINPTSGELVTDNINDETKQVMENIAAILAEAKISFSHIVKTTILLSDMSLFAKVNEVYGSYFTEMPPARETFAVKGLPRGVNVEISTTAVVDL